MASLGESLFSELVPRFFGLLAGPNARIYLDVVDALEREMPSRGEAMERAEVLEIIEHVLAGGTVLQEETDDAVGEAESLSGQVLRRLLAAGWMEEERRSDYRRLLFLEPAAQTLLEAIRAIVSQSVASFTGRLRLVCDRLSALRLGPSRRGKQVERYAKRQLKAASIAEALDIIYNEFSSLITQQCYREMVHARLPERLREAMEGLRELEQDDEALQHLQEDFLRTHPGAQAAMPEILRVIGDLSLALGDVEPTADRVDASAADFARRSRSRIRYIQDIGSARRQQVKTIFDHVREGLPEVRFGELDDKLELPAVLLAETGLVGEASLARGRRKSNPADRRPVAAALSDQEREESLREMEKNIRNALRLDRANRFVERMDLQPGDRRGSNEMEIHGEDDLLDVISCLVFAQAGGAKFFLRTLRDMEPTQEILMDSKGEFEIERFEIEQKS
ncbi:MAG: hypothetical protein EBY32_03295 [Proteobacteria bacterium]|nr:hypothetical protein [Pseudomonadota bacterium]